MPDTATTNSILGNSLSFLNIQEAHLNLKKNTILKNKNYVLKISGVRTKIVLYQIGQRSHNLSPKRGPT